MVSICAHRADLATSHTVFSVLGGEHSNGGGILGFFDTREARALRLVSSEISEAVSCMPWFDLKTKIKKTDKWRTSFPRAIGAKLQATIRGRNISRRVIFSMKDSDFAHLVGVHTIDMSECEVTDAAFAHLAGIHTLIMLGCNQRTITDAAFAHLSGIHTLIMSGCNQRTITDAAFAHLAGVHTLDMSWCEQATITDAAFAHLAGVHTLDMRGCDQPTITDAALAHLVKVENFLGPLEE